MSVTIAISGKGGSGKTSVSAMIVRHLVERGARGVLAVDADPNSCLGLALGVETEITVADIREQTRDRKVGENLGEDRGRAFEYALQRAVAEAEGFDLLSMGRPEGPQCYCAINHLLRKYLDQAGRDYKFIVVDTEAGMEHLSRRTTDAVDHLLIIAEPTRVGATTARRIMDLSQSLPITVRRRAVLWNKVADPPAGRSPMAGEGPAPLDALKGDLPVIGAIPYDKAVLDGSMRGTTVFELPADSPAFAAVGEVVGALEGIPAQPSRK